MFGTIDQSTICLKTVMLEYLRTGDECYNTLINYINNGSRGDLNLCNTPITSLPEGLTVGGDLSLIKTKITSLPQDLKVGGDLSLMGTIITSLPEGLKVGKDLYLHNTPISKNHNKKQLKRMLPNVRGKIFRI